MRGETIETRSGPKKEKKKSLASAANISRTEGKNDSKDPKEIWVG